LLKKEGIWIALADNVIKGFGATMIYFRQIRETESSKQKHIELPKRMPRVICQMRIRNEEKWLLEVLDSIATVADGIVILDDGSTDHTPDICRSHPAVLEYVQQNEPILDEVRDKNRLLQMALAHNPDWVLSMDGDEILEDSASERILKAIRECPPSVTILDIEFLYMWNDLKHYRTDGIYRRIFHHRLFKLENQDTASLHFRPTSHGGNFHCESVPSNLFGRSVEIDVKVKHLGYMDAQDRERKYKFYKSKDPVHAVKGYYEHLLDQPGMTIEAWQERPFVPSPQITYSISR
jgi:O-antigen biosynthesis protein